MKEDTTGIPGNIHTYIFVIDLSMSFLYLVYDADTLVYMHVKSK